MRIPSGVTDQVLYFVAVDATDLKTRESTLTNVVVYSSRDGGAINTYDTPTVASIHANMPGVHTLLLDEDMTIAAGNDSEEYCVHITADEMAPVTRTFELYRPKITAGETLTVASGSADISTANVTTGCTSSLNTYDPPTRGELTADVATLATAAALTTVDNEIATLQATADTLATAAALTTVDTEVGNIQTDVTTIVSNTTGLATAAALATVDTEVGLIQTDVTEIAGDTDTIITNTTGLATASALTTHDGKLDTLTTNVATVDTEVGNIQTDVTTLLGRVTSTLFSGITSLAGWLRALARSDAADAGVVAEINDGVGDYDETADSQEAIAGAGGGGAPTVEQIWTHTTRELTGGANLNDLSTADIDARISAAGLATAASVASLPTTAAIATAVLGETVEGTLTLKQVSRLLAAALCGEITVSGTTVTVKSATNAAKTRATATTDASNQRTAITLDVTD